MLLSCDTLSTFNFLKAMSVLALPPSLDVGEGAAPEHENSLSESHPHLDSRFGMLHAA